MSTVSEEYRFCPKEAVNMTNLYLAEYGRSAKSANISPFIEWLPTVYSSYFTRCERFLDLPREQELFAVINRMKKSK